MDKTDQIIEEWQKEYRKSMNKITDDFIEEQHQKVEKQTKIWKKRLLVLVVLYLAILISAIITKGVS